MSVFPFDAHGNGSPQHGGAGLKVLVVDDHMDGAEALGILLEVMGNEVSLAFDGQQAVDRVKTWHPDLVLMDLSLPVLNGCEAARCIFEHARQTPGFPTPTMVAVSGFSGEGDFATTAAAGFYDHVVKPLSPERLKTLLEQARMARSQAMHAVAA